MDPEKRAELSLKYLRIAHDVGNDHEFCNRLVAQAMDKDTKLGPEEGGMVLAIVKTLHHNNNFREMLKKNIVSSLAESPLTLADLDTSWTELAQLTVVPR